MILSAFSKSILWAAAGIVMISCAVHASEPVSLDKTLTVERLGTRLEFYKDDSGALRYADVSGKGYDRQFKKIDRDNPSFGYTGSTYWFRFTARNTETAPLLWYLEYDYPLIDSVELYLPSPAGFSMVAAGDTLPFNEWPVRYRSLMFPVNQNPGETAYYLRVRSNGAIYVPVSALSAEFFNDRREREGIWLWLLYGIILALAFYNAFIFISIREKNYLQLALFTLSVGLYSMVNNGLAFQYLWPSTVRWTNLSQPVLLFLTLHLLMTFSRNFLNVRERNPRCNILFRVIAWLLGIGMFSAFVIPYRYISPVSALMIPATGVLLLLYCVYSVFKGNREARIYLAAMSVLLVGASLAVLRGFGLMPRSFLTEWSPNFGATMLVFLLSFGVTDKINFMRRERDRAEVQREKALKALRDSEEKYRALVENAFEGILLLMDNKPVYANRALIDMTGYSEKEFFTVDFFNDVLPDTPLGKDLIKSNYASRMTGGDPPGKYEAQIKSKSGDIVDVIISAAVIEVDGKKGSLSVITDITDRKKAEAIILRQMSEIHAQYAEMEALNEELTSTQDDLLEASERIKREKEQLLITLRSIGDAVITLDRENRVVLMNSVAEALLRFGADEVVGRDFGELALFKDQDGSLVEITAGELMDGNAGARTLTMMSRDGRERTVEIKGSAIRAAGVAGGLVLAIRDITERIKVEQELSKISKIEGIGVLAGGIAHDFNNLLTAIVGNASLAAEMASGDKELLDILTSIAAAGERATSLTHQLLTFAKGGEPVKKATSVVELLHESANFVLAGSKVRCDMIIGNDIPPLEIDANQVSHAINNLIINAMQSMPEGGIVTIRADRIDAVPKNVPLEEGPFVKISIEDRGEGIPSENIDKIFDPYFTTKKTGSGLGLTSAFSIIKRHGGHIEASSVPGKGSVFTVYLKSSGNKALKEVEVTAAAEKRSGKILVMDDEDDVRKVTAMMLKRLGYDVTVCAGGEEAVALYREHYLRGEGFNAVIMDLTVPGGMGGRDALVKIREIDGGVVAVVSSGYSNDPVMSNFETHGFSGILVKPFTLQDLSKVMEDIRR